MFSKFTWVFIAAILTMLFACSAGNLARADNHGFTPLFNGKNLDGWYTMLQKYLKDGDPEKVITIEDGILHAYKHNHHGDDVVMGYIGTNDIHRDYHFRMKYKWGKKQFFPRFIPKPDSGVYFHHVAADAVWPQALQFQVELHDTGDLLTVGRIKVDTEIDPKTRREDWQQHLPASEGGVDYTTTGQGVTYTRRKLNAEKEGWNTIELIVRGDAGAHIVNGQLVNRFSNIKQIDPNDPEKWIPLTEGRILIEFEATEIFFRDIEIRQLGSEESLDAAIKRATK